MKYNLKFLSMNKSNGILELIDKDKYLGFNTSTTDRLDLFLYAMALGINNPTTTEKKESLVRPEYIRDKVNAMPMLSSIFIGGIKEFKDISKIKVDSELFEYAENCANTGFKYIETAIKKNSPENMELSLTAELEELYKRNILNN